MMKLLLIALAAFVSAASAALLNHPHAQRIAAPNADGRSKRSVSAYAQAQLDVHNNYRAIHGASPMTLDNGLMTEAQGFADYLANVHCSMEHCFSFDSATYTMVPKFNTVGCQAGMAYSGENLAYSWGSGSSNLNATKMWYEEAFYYDFCNHGFTATLPGHEGKAVGHFTQVVWKNSIKLGIGKATGCNGKTFVVGRYSPPGNYMSQFADQVGPAPAYLAGNGGCGGGDGTDTGAPEEVPEEEVVEEVVEQLADPDARRNVCGDFNMGFPSQERYQYPNVFGLPACELICYKDPYYYHISSSYVDVTLDCKRGDDTIGHCDSGNNCV